MEEFIGVVVVMFLAATLLFLGMTGMLFVVTIALIGLAPVLVLVGPSFVRGFVRALRGRA